MIDDLDLLAAIPAPSDADALQPPGTYLAAAGDWGWLHVAVVIDGGRALGYLCDGHVVGDWLEGSVEHGRLRAEGPRGSHLDARVRPGTVRGSATAAGFEPVEFEARPPAPGDGGLYRTEDDPEQGFTLGWIVLEDGTRGLSCHPDGRVAAQVNWAPRPRSSTHTADAIRIARAAADAFGRAITHGEIERYLDLLDPEVEFETASATRRLVRLHGHAELRQYLEQAADDYYELKLEPGEIRELDDGRFIVFGRWRGRGTGGGNPFGAPLAAILTFKGGRVVRLRGFMDEQQALEAARSEGGAAR